MATATKDLLRSRDPKRVKSALDLMVDGQHRMQALEGCLTLALRGSNDAAREYVRGYRELTMVLLDEVQQLRPDYVVRLKDGTVAVVDVKGRPTRAPVEALVTASAEAPFGPWTSEYRLGEAVALDLTSRVRQLVGLRGLAAPVREGAVEVPVDDLAAERFVRRVRHWLNRPGDQHPLLRVKEAFGLTKTELASLFGVRRQAIDNWIERGVPSDRAEKLQTLESLADLLERKLKTDRLPGVARRAADAYGGRTMLELIEANRHDELLEMVRDSFDWASAA